MHFIHLRDLPAESNKTLAYIGKLLDCSPKVYRRYEKGIREIPAWVLIRLSVYYNTSVDYLLGLADNPQAYECPANMENMRVNAGRRKTNRGRKLRPKPRQD